MNQQLKYSSSVNKLMALHKQRYYTQVREQVFIPPLNLGSSPKLTRTKQSLTFFKTQPLDQNQDFLKQKSLYRYAISRKLNKQEFNKSHACLLAGAVNRDSKGKQKLQNEFRNAKAHSKEKSFQQKTENQQSKERYFRRKNRNERQKSFSNIFDSTNSQSVDNNTQQENVVYCKSNNSQKVNINFYQLQDSNTDLVKGKNQIRQIFQKQVKTLKKQIQNLTLQNKTLRQKLKQKDRQFQTMQTDFLLIKKDNQRLLHDAKRNIRIHSENFIIQNKLQGQLILRDTIIQQLQSSIKYMELQNITLKKSKSQSIKQADIIRHLQKDKKLLQENVRVLYKQRTKRNKMRGSLISEYSDLSLNLSLDEEDPDKMLNVLKTAERTPQKLKKPLKNTSSSVRENEKELLSPSWRPKQQNK